MTDFPKYPLKNNREYPQTFDPKDRYIRAIYPNGEEYLHSHDLNDSQAMLGHQIKGVGDVLLKDGNVVHGGVITVHGKSGRTILESGGVYIGGMVHDVDEAKFTIPVDRLVSVGVCLVEDIVTYEDDVRLKGAILATDSYGEPGADRLRRIARWTYDEATCEGAFFEVYQVDHGVIIDKKPPPQFDPINSALARYDREANGHYVVSGWETIALGPTGGAQIFSIGEGTINVWGSKVTREAAMRIVVDEDADLYEVESEPHIISNNASGNTKILLNHGPVARIDAATILSQKKERLTHGAYSGVSDPLPDTSVAQIIKVSQGGKVYKEGSDFTRKGDSIDWSKMGDEPAPGSTYDVIYRYLDTVKPVSWDDKSVTVKGVVPGSTAIIKYQWALPRVDLIVVNREGRISYIKGHSTMYDPWPPNAPNDMIPLAEIVNHWGRKPEVRNVATHSVHYNMLETHGDMIYDLYDLVAQERLRRDMDSRTVTTKRGLFVDSFLDDDMRDQGIEQTGAIVGEALQLSISPTINTMEKGEEPFLLPYKEETVISQPLVTGCMKINPYMAFEPLPASVRLSPAVDIWTVVRTRWLSDVTRRIIRGWGNRSRTTTSQVTERVREERRAAQFLRPRTIRFWIKGFGSGEILDKIEFDGVEVAPRKV
ncbi:MAG: DUF4815 domain-containing protein [Hyphomicrobiaceae bacterium]|nr:DUF4815 domain-containing protein [Hyphomicrobiaceae bacterium]